MKLGYLAPFRAIGYLLGYRQRNLIDSSIYGHGHLLACLLRD